MIVFPQQLLHDLHKKSPGSVYLLAHTHPPGMTQLSNEDITTLKAQALAMYPFPVRMSTITLAPSPISTNPNTEIMLESIYLGFWEDKDSWRDRCKRAETPLPRQFTIVKESFRPVSLDGMYNSVLVNMSYTQNEKETCLVRESS